MRSLLTFPIAIVVVVWATAQAATCQLEVLAESFEHPWSITFLPDGAILVTKRPGYHNFSWATPGNHQCRPLGDADDAL
jgi:glucose/arabinose dehydrogenase